MRPTLRQLFFIILFAGLFLLTLQPVTDPDFWWHLRTGQLIAQTHAIPYSDPFSFTNNGTPWIAHEWLSELLFFGLYRLGSYGLLVFVFSLITTGAFLLSYLRSPQESKPYVAGFVLFLGAIVTVPTWGVRPQIISLLLTSLLLYLLDRYVAERKRILIVFIPLITLLWVNLHAGYLLGLIIVAIYIGGGLLERLKAKISKNEPSEAPSLKSIALLGAVLGLSVLATLANPNGAHILQWQPLAWFFLAFIGTGMLIKKNISPTKILLTLVFGYAALRSMRFVPLFVIVSIPILAEQIDSVVRIKSAPRELGRLAKWLIPAISILLVLLIGLRWSQVVKEQPAAEAATFPKSALDWLVINHPAGKIFNSYTWGGYLIWRLYPQYPVFIDGRADVYGDQFIFKYIDIYNAHPGWEQALEAQSVNLALVEPNSGLANALRQSLVWKIAYEDKISIVFERNE
jgi:hypothetical protein